MASNEISKFLKMEKVNYMWDISYRTPEPLITGEKLLGTLKIRYHEFYYVSLKSWKTNQCFVALPPADVLPICLLKRMSAALRLRKSCSRRWKVPFQLLQRDFLGTCRMWVSLSGNSDVQFVQCLDCVEHLSSFSCLTVPLVEWQWLLEQNCLSITECSELNIISPVSLCLRKILNEVVQSHFIAFALFVGCTWVLEPVSGSAEGRHGKVKQNLEERTSP